MMKEILLSTPARKEFERLDELSEMVNDKIHCWEESPSGQWQWIANPCPLSDPRVRIPPPPPLSEHGAVG